METRSRLQNALARTHVPQLVRMRLRPVLDASRHPIVVEGSEAIVARLTRSDGAMRALRVPVSRDRGERWEGHYRTIAERAPKAAAAVLPQAIEVIGGGITLGGTSFPAILMEWIDGPTVQQAADRAARTGNGAVLHALADSLKELAQILRRAGVVHGDLAADNLLVRSSGDLVCVDLDGLQWPGSASVVSGQPSAAYRHPSRTASGNQRDAFALLVQYVSLLVLADAPDLRRTFGEPVATHGGALLFTPWDLSDPTTSRAFREVRERVGPETRELVDALRTACMSDGSTSPGILANVFDLPQEEEVPATTAADSQETATWDLSGVINRLRTQYQDPRETWRMPAAPSRESVSPPVIPPRSNSPEDDRVRLQEAIARGNDAEVIGLASRLADDPIAQLYKLDVELALARGYRDRISHAAEQGRDDAILLLAAEAESRRLPLDPASRRAVRHARERIEVRTKLEEALSQDNRPALADLAVSGELVVLGDADRASLQRVLQALEWPSLRRALETDDDTLILEACDDELFAGGAALPPDARARVVLARSRVGWLSDVRAALKQRDVHVIARLFAHEPEGGAERLSVSERMRAVRLLEQQAALDALEQALHSGNDTGILEALHTIDRVGARVEDRFTWSVVRGVMQRATVIESIVTAATDDPPDDRQLAHLLPVARTMGLMHDPMLKDDLAWDRLQAIVRRGAAVRRIRRAIAQGDERAIRRAAYPDVTGALALLTDAERVRVEDTRTRRRAG